MLRRSWLRGPACVLERLPQAVAGLLSDLAVSGDVGAGEDQLPSAPQATGNRIKYKKVDAETGARSTQIDIIKGYEVSKGEYIELEPEELEAVAIESKRMIEIEEFVPKAEIDELYLRDPYYIVPDGEVGPAGFRRDSRSHPQGRYGRASARSSSHRASTSSRWRPAARA